MPNQGTVLWASAIGYDKGDSPNQIARILTDRIVGAGSFNPFLGSGFLAGFDVVAISGPTLQANYVNTYGAPTSGYAFIDVATDSGGNLLMLGWFTGTINFNNGNPANDLVGNGVTIFVVKLTASGSHVWSKSFGGYDYGIPGFNQGGFGIAVDSDDSVIVTGSFVQSFSVTLDGGGTATLSTNQLHGMFLIKLNSLGGILWANGYSSTDVNGAGKVRGVSVCVDPSKNIYVTGYVYLATSFGAQTITPPTQIRDIFIAKYNPSGANQWAVGYGDTSSTSSKNGGTRIKSDSDGNIYAIGLFSGTTTFYTSVKTAGSGRSAFALRIDPVSRAVIWIDTWGSGTIDCNGLDTSILKNPATGKCDIVVGGSFAATIDMGNGLMSPISVYGDAFVGTFNSTGSCLWSDHYGVSNQGTTANGATFDSAGNVWVLGSFFGTLTFPGGVSITSTGSQPTFFSDWFIAQVSMGGGISPPNPADFTAVYAPSSNTSFQSKFGFKWTGSLPVGASNILLKYLFPTGTIFPTPNVETTPFLLLNYPEPGGYFGVNAYGFVYKVTGGDGPLWNIPFGYTTIQNWQWAAAWADSTGAKLGSYTAWQSVNKNAAVNIKNNGTLASTPYANLKVTTFQTARGPMQTVGYR